MYIVLAIIAFGILIFVHELGHFLVAKACGVKVTEFSMGMGPQLLHRQKGETVYSLRALPVGGFCAMEGEDGPSEDPRAFVNHSVLHRLLILCAGSAMNFLLGLALILILYAGSRGFASPEIRGFVPDCPYEGDLQVGDRIWSINGHRIYYTSNFIEFTAEDRDGDVDLVLLRDGKKVRLDGYHLVPREYTREDGAKEMKYGINFLVEEATIVSRLRYSWYTCLDFVRMVWRSLVMLFTGGASMKDMTGVVGIVDIINETGQSASSASEGFKDIIYLVAFIAVNLSVMNMLPIPALDGGHVLTLLISSAIEKISGKKPDPRIEGYIHYIGLILLLLLMAFVLFNDVARILKR